MELFELIFTSMWMPLSANIIWCKKVDNWRRALSIVLMMIAYVFTMYKSYSEMNAIVFFPISCGIIFFCFKKDVLSFILVPGTYILCVLSNLIVGILLGLIKTSRFDLMQEAILRMTLSSLTVILLSLFIRKVFIFYKTRVDYRNSKRAILTTILLLGTTAFVYLINGWQLRKVGWNPGFENWYLLVYIGQAVIIIGVFISITKNIQTTEKALREEENRRNLLEYTHQIENMYEELRSFKHDYANVLLTLSGFIDNNDMEGLSKYYQETILPTNEKINQGKYHLHKLSRIQEPAIKGMLSAKFINAMNLGIDLFVDIMDDIPDISMSVLDLTRVLGIYIDNAVEAALETVGKEVKFNVVLDSNSIVIVIANSFINKGVAINEIEKRAVSTKGEGRGIGLSNVNEILREYPNVNKMTEIKDKYFVQTLIIENV